MSRMSPNAATNITTRMSPRSTNGTAEARLLGDEAAGDRSAEHRRPGRDLAAAEHRLDRAREARGLSASTSHASTAPEKNVKPSPIRIETTAQCQNGASTCHSSTYSNVEAESVTVPSRYETRLPAVSATIPVGTSNSTIPAVKKAFAAKASRFDSPASSRKIVLIPQIRDAASVFPKRSSRYVRWIERGVGTNVSTIAGGRNAPDAPNGIRTRAATLKGW